MKTVIVSLVLAALANPAMTVAPAAAISKTTTYGPQLQGFDYPYPLQRFGFTSQQQGLEMAYMDVAPQATSNGRTVVLLHGKNFCGATWEQTIRVLSANGFRVVVPDQIGFCASSKPRGYQFSFAQLAANTNALLKSLGIDKITLVGHSMGGMLATRYALNHAQTVQQLVLVNPIGLEDWQAAGVPYATIDELYQNELKTTFDSIKAYQQRFYYHDQWKPEYDRWVQMQAGLYAGAGRNIVTWNQAQTAEMLFTQPVVHEFGQIRVPTVLLIGSKDRTAPGANRAAPDIAQKLGNYPELGKRASNTIPNAKLVEFAELGHAPQVESPAVFHDALLRELKM